MPRKCFRDVVADHFFLLHQFFIVTLKKIAKKNSCDNKEILASRKENVLSLHQGNIFLASKNISVSEIFLNLSTFHGFCKSFFFKLFMQYVSGKK